VTFEFFEHQLVCHLDKDYRPARPTIYPRHFGITFKNERDFDAVLRKAEQEGLAFLRREFTRFEGRPEEHRTFLLLDPADNVLEFKYYNDPACIY
jgi:extradiol dioxygenase family protein